MRREVANLIERKKHTYEKLGIYEQDLLCA